MLFPSRLFNVFRERSFYPRDVFILRVREIGQIEFSVLFEYYVPSTSSRFTRVSRQIKKVYSQNSNLFS